MAPEPEDAPAAEKPSDHEPRQVAIPPRADSDRKRARRPYTELQGVERAIQIIEAVGEKPLRASAIAKTLGLKWTTAHRSISNLLDGRYLQRDESTGLISIGPRVYYLGQTYLINHPLRTAAAPGARALALETAASTTVAEREGIMASTLLVVDAKFDIIPRTGFTHFPLNVGSPCHVILAYSPPYVFQELVSQPLIAFTDRSITDPDVLLRRITEVRKQGFAVTRGDVRVGIGSVAAPIFSSDGVLAGAINVVVAVEELTDARAETLVSLCSRTADEISLRLGWQYGVPPAAVAQWSPVSAK